jgi:hypothetical protein
MHITGLKMFDMFIDPPGRPATLEGRFSSSNRPVGLNFATKNRPSEGRGGAVRGSCGSISRSTYMSIADKICKSSAIIMR